MCSLHGFADLPLMLDAEQLVINLLLKTPGLLKSFAKASHTGGPQKDHHGQGGHIKRLCQKPRISSL